MVLASYKLETYLILTSASFPPEMWTEEATGVKTGDVCLWMETITGVLWHSSTCPCFCHGLPLQMLIAAKWIENCSRLLPYYVSSIRNMTISRRTVNECALRGATQEVRGRTFGHACHKKEPWHNKRSPWGVLPWSTYGPAVCLDSSVSVLQKKLPQNVSQMFFSLWVTGRTTGDEEAQNEELRLTPISSPSQHL